MTPVPLAVAIIGSPSTFQGKRWNLSLPFFWYPSLEAAEGLLRGDGEFKQFILMILDLPDRTIQSVVDDYADWENVSAILICFTTSNQQDVFHSKLWFISQLFCGPKISHIAKKCCKSLAQAELGWSLVHSQIYNQHANDFRSKLLTVISVIHSLLHDHPFSPSFPRFTFSSLHWTQATKIRLTSNKIWSTNVNNQLNESY